MRASPAAIALFETLRPTMLARAAALRPRLETDSDVADDRAAAHRRQIEAVLNHTNNLLISGDIRSHRDFLHTFMAVRASEAVSPTGVITMLTEIGDTAGRVVGQNGDTAGHRELIMALTLTTALTVKICNDLIARDLEHKTAQRNGMRAGR